MLQGTQDKEIKEGRFFALISYLVFLCIVSLILKKDNKFALFHAKQGLVIFVLEVATLILSVISFLQWLRVAGLVIFGLLSLWGILEALRGNYRQIPLVSKIAQEIIL